MNSSQPVFYVYLAAVDALRDYCDARLEILNAKESSSQYSFSHTVEMNSGWEQRVSNLAKKLRDAFFDIDLTIKVDSYRADLRILNNANTLVVACESYNATQDMLSFPEEAIKVLEHFKDTVKESCEPEKDLALKEIFTDIKNFLDLGAAVEITLSASLTKGQIGPEPAPDGTVVLQKVVYYLFADNLLSELENMTIEQWETDFCEPQKRTVIVLFDSTDLLVGEFLVLCGRNHDDELKDSLIKPLANESVGQTQKSLDFKGSEILGKFQTKWITPNYFAVTSPTNQTTATTTNLVLQLKSFQTLLSVLFLADYIDVGEDEYQVEYRGIGVTKMRVTRSEILNQTNHFNDVYKLFAYAYEGFFADKLEIVQQFVSLMVSSLNSLCNKSTEIREAAENTYAIVLKDKVGVYFDALNKIQERIKTAIDKSAESVISLSRDVSNDVYKVAGIIAAAISVALLKPDFGWSVALAASLVMGFYLLLVIFYHLETLKRSHHLSDGQHIDYIKSYEELMGATKIKEFLNDPHWKQAKDLFLDKRSMAVTIYTWGVIISLGVALTILGHRILKVR